MKGCTLLKISTVLKLWDNEHGAVFVEEGGKIIGALGSETVFAAFKKADSQEAAEKMIRDHMKNRETSEGLLKIRKAELIFIGNTASRASLMADVLNDRGIPTVVVASPKPVLEWGRWCVPWGAYWGMHGNKEKAWIIDGGSLWEDHRDLPRRLAFYNGEDLRTKGVPQMLPAIVSTKDLVKRCPGSEWFPRTAQTYRFRPLDSMRELAQDYKDRQGVDFILAHFASRRPEARVVKGSDVADRVPKLLRERGFRVDYLTTYDEGIPRWLMPGALNYVDVVLDQFCTRIRAHGIITIEASLCGTPAISNCEPKHEELPGMVVHADTPEEAADAIQQRRRPAADRTDMVGTYSPEATASRMIRILKEKEVYAS